MSVFQKNSKNCFLLLSEESTKKERLEDLISGLQKNDDEKRKTILREILKLASTGVNVSPAVISVIKYCASSADKALKRLSLLFWQVLSPSENDEDYMLLICNGLLQDLNHHNELIRSATLRLLFSFNEPKLTKMLMPMITENLCHSDPHVRKNAVLVIHKLIERNVEAHSNICEKIYKMIRTEKDEITRSNCFAVLAKFNRELALKFLVEIEPKLLLESPFFQAEVVEFIRSTETTQRTMAFFSRCLVTLIKAEEPSIVYEAIDLLLIRPSLSMSMEVVNQAISSAIELVNSSSDNNVKIFLLNRISSYISRYPDQISDNILDLEEAIYSYNEEVQRTALKIVRESINLENMSSVIKFLKKHLESSKKDDTSKNLIVDSIYSCALKFPVATYELFDLILNLAKKQKKNSIKLLSNFIRKAITSVEMDSETIVRKLIDDMDEIADPLFLRLVLWLTSVFSKDSKTLLYVLEGILKNFTFESENDDESRSIETKSALETMIFDNKEYYLATYLSSALAKLILNLRKFAETGLTDEENALINKLTAKSIILLSRIMEKTEELSSANTLKRVGEALNSILSPENDSKNVLSDSIANFKNVFVEEQKIAEKQVRIGEPVLVSILGAKDKKLDLQRNLTSEKNTTKKAGSTDASKRVLEKMGKVCSLTGHQDEIYVEAVPSAHDFHYVVDYFLHNNVKSDINDVQLEIFSTGNIEKENIAKKYRVEKGGSAKVTQRFRVTSSDGGMIFGSLLYKTSSSGPCKILPLKHISLNIIDFLRPAQCKTFEFAEMWAELEWENKIKVCSEIKNLRKYLDEVSKKTKAACLEPENVIEVGGNFLSACLFAKSVFGESILVNVSVEKNSQGMTFGSVKIRSKRQGIARKLGQVVSSIV